MVPHDFFGPEMILVIAFFSPLPVVIFLAGALLHAAPKIPTLFIAAALGLFPLILGDRHTLYIAAVVVGYASLYWLGTLAGKLVHRLRGKNTQPD